MTAPTGPGTGTGSDHRPGPCLDPDADATGLRFDRADLDEPTTTAVAGAGWAVTGRGITVGDPLCGHLPGEPHDEACDYWRGVALGEYPTPAGMPGPYGLAGCPGPPFPLDELRAQRMTAGEWDRLHGRGAA